MVIIVLVNLDRRRGNSWEGYLSGGTHDTSIMFEGPGSGDLAMVRVSRASFALVTQGELEMGPGAGWPEVCSNRMNA